MSPSDVQARLLRRVDVGTATTTGQLFDLVTASTAAALTSSRPFAAPSRWTDHSGGPLGPDAFDGGRLRLDPGPRAWRGADLDAARAGFWSGYRVRMRVGGLGVPGAGGFGGVRVLLGDPRQIQVAVSGDWLSIRQGVGDAETAVVEAPLPPRAAHDISVAVRPGWADVVVDGSLVGHAAVGG